MRNKEIKIRLSDDEHQELLAKMSGGELASWMRDTCLGKKTKRRNPPPKADPDLLRQLSGIGNNLNQLARQVNSGALGAGDTVQILTALAAIEDELKRVKSNAG